MSDYDRQYQEDLERAQALSLESLALEEFRNKKLQEQLRIQQEKFKPKNSSVVRAASMSETDSAQIKYDRQSSRPRPGSSTNNPSGSLIAPPPTSQRKSSSSSNISDSPDLISFSSPPPPVTTNHLINFINSQPSYNNNVALATRMRYSYSTPPQLPSPPVMSNLPATYHPQFRPPMHNFVRTNISITHPYPMANPLPPQLNQMNNTQTMQIRPQLPPPRITQTPTPPPVAAKNQIRTAPPIDSSSLYSVVRKKENTLNLIDLSQFSDNRNSVRVSILEEFDPLSTASCSFRTISPECSMDDAASVCDSVYDEYDPYDYIHAGSGANSIGDPIYATIKRQDSAPQSPPPLPPKTYLSAMKEKWSLLDNIIRHNDRSKQIKNPDWKGFYEMVVRLRSSYHYNDANKNIGLVISPMLTLNQRNYVGLSVKLCVHPDFPEADFDKPITFTCDVTTSIEHVTLQAQAGLEAPGHVNYTLKVKGCDEYLAPTTFLSDYEYVHNCIKLEEDIILILIPDDKMEKVFARTRQDDEQDTNIKFDDVIPYDQEPHINYDNLILLIETIEKEIKKLEDDAYNFDDSRTDSFPQCEKVIQSVKYVVNLLGNLNTLEIMDAVAEFDKICELRMRPCSEKFRNACNKVRLAVQSLLELYSSAFAVNFEVKTMDPVRTSYLNIQDVFDSVLVRVNAIYRPPERWKYHSYLMEVRIYHGSRQIKSVKFTNPIFRTSQERWPDRIVFDYWYNFENIKINLLARESRLVFVLHGRSLDETDNDDNAGPKFQEEEIGWSTVQLFDFDRKYKSGKHLLTVWPTESKSLYGPAPAAVSGNYPMVGVEIVAVQNIQFPASVTKISNPMCDFNSLDNQTQELLLDVCDKNMLWKIPPDIREILWEKRHYLYQIPKALPKVLLAATSWSYSELPELHSMLNHWKHLEPIQALELLLPTFPDLEVRKMAIRMLRKCQIDELIDYLPQLVVALRFETYDTSELAYMMLEYSLVSPRFAHTLFWLLTHKLPNIDNSIDIKEPTEQSEVRFLNRMRLIWKALLAICGESLRNSFLRQQLLVKNLNDTAENVQKQPKDVLRMSCLTSGLSVVNELLSHDCTSLPLSPTLRANGIDLGTCNYFQSNTVPLKINFKMIDKSLVPIIYKVGDDLQQDMLTLQIVRLMDKLWLKEGLDLKIVTFKCVPTGFRRGMIEMVQNSETLRIIQLEHDGVTGPFKDKSISEWLKRHNPSELEYERAVQNFTASCAGYCVATYILGICDRHNDNIMLKTSGHLFHIDFGKFLGDAQMFMNFKRDRVPFVLTSDMAYVINGGDKATEKFHVFVDLCCQAFNIIRNNANLFICLFTMMASSGITGVTADSITHLKHVLLLEDEKEVSNPEAAAKFARMIQSSLKSWFTQVNFFIHNLAQLKFTTDTSDRLLSFVPKVYNKETDGRIVEVSVMGFKKRYDPDKYYVYVLRVSRENEMKNMEIQRTYKEFCELHQKLCIAFPLADQLSSLSTGLHMGRSNIKQVAYKRYIEIIKFVESLFKCSDEICHSPVVYTFFHPILRDQQDDTATRGGERVGQPYSGKLSGQIKLMVEFNKQGLTVMVKHVRGLPKLANGQEPSTYVKVYLKPDEKKESKRKTKVVKKNCHPSFMETLIYRLPKERIKDKVLQASVYHYDALQENEFMGGIELRLSDLDLNTVTDEWYPLSNITR